MTSIPTPTPTPTPTEGSLVTAEGRALPLRRTDVRGKLVGPVASVTVEQRFENDTEDSLEAVYLFPLPDGATVSSMVMRIDGREVRAHIAERKEAKRQYERALSEGRRATLLEEDRPTLFSLRVANITPGATIEVSLDYQVLLGLDHGEWRFVFPMVAPKRYRPRPSTSTTASSSALDGVALPRIPSGERTADVTLSLEIHGEDSAPEALRSPTHRVEITALEDGGKRVRLHESEHLPNRDFVLTYAATDHGVRPKVTFDREAGEPGTFLLTVTPPKDGLPRTETKGHGDELDALACGNCGGLITNLESIRDLPGLGPAVPCSYCGAVLAPSTRAFARATRPRDVVILVDRSASMRTALPTARRAVKALLAALRPGDAIQLFAFDHAREAFDGEGAAWVTLAPEVAARCDAFVAGLTARGGSEIERALARAGELPARDGRTTSVVLLTDAAIGDEGRLLRRVEQRFGDERRLFVLGVGAVNDERLVRRLANAGGGASDVLPAGTSDIEPVVERFARRVREGGPVLTGLSLSWDGAEIEAVAPASLGELYGGAPLTVLGRFRGEGTSTLVLTGSTADGRPFRQELTIDLPAASDQAPGLARLWAKARVDALLARLEKEPSEARQVEEEVTVLGLAHSLVTPYTSLIAEDSEVVAEDDPATRTVVPVAEPETGPAGMMRAAAAPMAAEHEAADAAYGGAHEEMLTTRCGGPPPPVACAAPPPPCSPAPAGVRTSVPRKRKGGVLSRARDFIRGDGSGGRLPAEAASQMPLHTDVAYPEDELAWLRGRTTGELDLVFLVDETGSMGPYIEQVKRRLLELVRAVEASPLCTSLRLALVTYRDHPPMDSSYASKVTPLTGDIGRIEAAVRKMSAEGGGDGPESVTDGLAEVVRLDWRPEAARAVVWFGDAPPHGVSPGSGDHFPQGCPCGNHWYTQAESLGEMGIAVYAVGCLPALSRYVGGEECYRLVARASGGMYLPLHGAQALVPLIVGAAATELDKQRLDAHVSELLLTFEGVLADTDEDERVRFLRDALTTKGVRARAVVHGEGATSGAAPALRDREVEAEDVRASLGRLRYRRCAA